MVFEFQMPIPGKGHEYVGDDEQGDGEEAFHCVFFMKDPACAGQRKCKKKEHGLNGGSK